MQLQSITDANAKSNTSANGAPTHRRLVAEKPNLNGHAPHATEADIRRAAQCSNPNCDCHGNGNVHCLTHEDPNPSLSVTTSPDGKVLLKCFAGCTQDALISEVKKLSTPIISNGRASNGHTAPPKPKQPFNWNSPDKYSYIDESGELLFEVVRNGHGVNKQIKARRPNGAGGWIYKLGDARRVLYNLPDVLDAKTVLMLEGEKAADAVNAALKAAGLYGDIVATTNPHGAGKWKKYYSASLAIKTVYIYPDNDVPGQDHAADVAQSLQGIAAAVKVVAIHGLLDKQGLDDWLNDGHSIAAALKLAEAAPEWKPEPAADEFVFEFTTDEKLDECFTGIEWLWKPYIPRGFVTAVVAEQGAGKSTVAQSFCDIILRGTRWPDGQPHEPQPDTKLLWIDTEGTLSLFHDHMKQWGMPRGRFIFPPDPLQELTIDDARTWLWIEKAIEKFKPPLVVIDALSGAHNAQANDEGEMKLIMKRLSTLAQRHNIALVVIHHLSKPAPGMKAFPVTVHRLRGSTAISQYCRSIIALGAPDESQPDNKRLDVIKLNLAKTPPAVGYELTDLGPAWGEAPEPPKERRAVDNAIDFLSVALVNGPRASNELEEEAKQSGIGRNALFDAKKSLKITARREGGKDGRWFWYPSETATVADGIEEGEFE